MSCQRKATREIFSIKEKQISLMNHYLIMRLTLQNLRIIRRHQLCNTK